MIQRTHTLLARLRRLFSRTEWAVRLLGLPRSPETSEERGLILLQIDGFSRTELERALRRRKMPFLTQLLQREEYELHTMYSGLPSATPAVQAELFYGVRCAVPAFAFRDHRTGQMATMYQQEVAGRIQRELEDRGANLLRDGSAYSDVYEGGKGASSFCVSSLGLSSVLREARLTGLFGVLLLHGGLLVRSAGLAVVEFAIAVWDLVRGVLGRQDFFKELKFIPTRVAVCVFLRDFVTIGVCLDAARGLPVIHANFLGYDEQAHRRGPSSRFAHWTLGGIDRAVRIITRAAERSACRDYDVWIHSDHGQEMALPYEEVYDEPVQEAVSRVFEEEGLSGPPADGESLALSFHHAVLLGGRLLQRLFAWPKRLPPATILDMAALGPVGHVYPPEGLRSEERDRVARALVTRAHIPLVLAPDEAGGAFAWAPTGRKHLPEDGAEVLGESHPYRTEAAHDLVDLVHNPDAGALVLCGWRPRGRPITLAMENGAHGGPGTRETEAFACLPSDAPVSGLQPTLRPADLREAAMRFLGRAGDVAPTLVESPTRAPEVLRVMTYNVHACIGLDGKHSPERLARVIARYAPDVVALQELDRNRARTDGVDQAHAIARALDMEYHFHPSFLVEDGAYGNAVLSRLPARLVKAAGLPRTGRREQRGALWVEVDHAGGKVQILNTHLGLSGRERRVQCRALLGPDWLGDGACLGPVVLCGDFNAMPGSRAYAELTVGLQDAQRASSGPGPRKTYQRVGRIDHVFTTPGMGVMRTFVPHTRLARMASDHLPLVADLAP